MAEISLELSVDILLSIDLVNERMETNSIFPVLVQEGNLNLVSLSYFQHVNRDGQVMVFEGVGGAGDVLAVDFILGDAHASEIEPYAGVGCLVNFEADCCSS